ncbi:MAG: VanW family protein, partial [Actinomycetota bacterium]|nr:VanW family protein [Actinomycetota bacterium]
DGDDTDGDDTDGDDTDGDDTEGEDPPAPTSIDRRALLPHVTTTVVDGELRLGLDPDGVTDVLSRELADLGADGGEATIAVEAGELVYTNGEPGMRCCGPGAADDLAAALTDPDPSPVPVTLVEVPGEDARERFVEELGIVERISTYTTEHPAGQSRVTNIHRIADILRGTIIEPGETFSINDTVGRRTIEKGFVAAGVIYQGVFTDDVGGGISQFATTLFNAAFFAGLDFGEYQSHSIYISRYPYGREATMSYPHPDLQVVNNTPYGILMWPTYTDSSITVSLYSTQYFEAGQLGQSQSAQGVCTRVTTTRQRTNLETGEVTTDSVFAVYRPEEGIACSGNPTPAATTTTTTTTVPETTTTTAPPTTTTTAAPTTTTSVEPAPGPPTSSTSAPTTTAASADSTGSE